MGFGFVWANFETSPDTDLSGDYMVFTKGANFKSVNDMF